MKKVNYFLSLAAAALMTAATVSCSSINDNPTPTPTPEPEPEIDNTGKNLIIKEVNVGGVKDANNKNYLWSKGIILYNNSGVKTTVKNLAIGTVPPGNAHGNFKTLDEEGNLIYENAGWVPAIYAAWFIPEITIEPYSDAVIAVNGAIDHTTLAPDAINFADASYYAMYDPESGYNNASAYPAPFEDIPEANYWKAAMFGKGNAWAISIMCPSFILFTVPEGVDLKTIIEDENNIWWDGNEGDIANRCAKIPTDWIIDGIEFYQSTKVDMSHKRLPASIDAGYGLYNNYKGYSAYRNVDKTATEAIDENAGKLVYDYNQEVLDTKDASGIDAAASLKNGAKIVYKDTNNSTDDFHVRATWSLK